jgi:prolyl oligopeptidase
MTHVLEPPPFTPAEPVTEVLHGVEITDPYRWLEDQNSPPTRKWIEEQTAYTRAYIDAIPGRHRIRKRVEELLTGKDVISDPWNVGDRYFFLKRQEGSEQPVIVMREGLFGEDKVLVDPALRLSGTSSAVAIAAISQDGRFLTYSVRQGGTDQSALEILDIEKNTVLPDRLAEGFCAGIAFAADGSGFYYSHRKLNDARPNYQAAFWHRFGTDQSHDQEVFFAGEEPGLFLGILHSHEAQLLAYVLWTSGKQPKTSIYLHSMLPGAAPKLLLDKIEGCFAPFFVRGQLLAITDVAAPDFRIVRIDLQEPDAAHWRDVVAESDRSIQGLAVAGDKIFVTRGGRFSSEVETYNRDGQLLEGRLFPHGTIDLLNRPNTTDKLFYNYTSFSAPTAIYCYDASKEELAVWSEANVRWDPSTIAVEEVDYTSRDGAVVPLLMVARKDLLHSGPLPTFLTGYGGFGKCVTPRFTAFVSLLLEQGFLVAVPALRGGAELGKQWHLAGKCANRQSAFDDFISAAEWLLANGRSAPDRIAVGGGSNAGLLVAAAITQRPDLFRAALCLGPLLDMTRYHLFDLAASWTDEYGSPDDERDFHALHAYSPYHRVRDRVAYPAVMFVSGDADTRCNPMHTRKMAALLQAASSSGLPILLDYQSTWGHTAVQPLTRRIDALTDRLAFICHEMGVSVSKEDF